jgi:hypothetical protein
MERAGSSIDVSQMSDVNGKKVRRDTFPEEELALLASVPTKSKVPTRSEGVSRPEPLIEALM